MSLKNDSVLILNRHLLAIQVCDVKSAVCALVTGKARVVDEEYQTYNLEEWKLRTEEIENNGGTSKYSCVLRSPSTRILAPQVIQIPDCEFHTSTIKVIKYSRQNIYRRDKYKCQYCNKKFTRDNLTLDHVIPRSKGGKSKWTNVVACCKACNEAKGDKSPTELGWKIPIPAKPSWRSHIGIPFDEIKKDYWKNFL